MTDQEEAQGPGLAVANEELPYCVPKRVPKYVCGFAEFLLNIVREIDPNIPVMRDTWQLYERRQWENYHARGKKRKKREKKEVVGEGNVNDVPESEVPKVHPSVRTALRRKMATLKRIADEIKSPEMNEILTDMNHIIST